MVDPRPDEQLLERYLAGDEAAFAILLQRYERPLFNFILRFVRRRELAEELFQDAFLRVIERAHEFRGQSKFSTWLYTIARNLSVDALRKLQFRNHASLDAEPRDGAPLIDRTRAHLPGPERAALGHQLRARLEVAIAELPAEQREVFVMREYGDLPFSEIASVTGVSENTAKSRMRYALERLRAALQEYEDYVPSAAS